MRIKYKVVEEKLYNVDIGNYTAFGIQMLAVSGRREMILDTVSDVSLDRKKIEQFVLDLNKFKLSPIHLMDVIEDFIS